MKAIEVWWEYIVGAALVVLAVCGFLLLTGLETRMLSRKTNRTAESMYDSYADSGREHRRYAKRSPKQ